jgi:hypothetical protein
MHDRPSDVQTTVLIVGARADRAHPGLPAGHPRGGLPDHRPGRPADPGVTGRAGACRHHRAAGGAGRRRQADRPGQGAGPAPLHRCRADAGPGRVRPHPKPLPVRPGRSPEPTERVLAERLAELGGTVERELEAESAPAVPGGYRVGGHHADGTPFAVTARFVAGADGAHSTVRSGMGLDFPGETYQQQFLLADIALTGRPCADNEAVICTSPRGVVVVVRMPKAPTASSPPCRPARGSPSTPTGPRSAGC